MQFTSLLVSLTLALLPVYSGATLLQYDNHYDDPNGSLSTVACSDGANGLLTKGFTTFGSLPTFPNIGAADAVAGWNSTSCGTCWQISYTNADGTTKTINVIAVDHAGSGFNVAQEAMDTLTEGNAVAFGAVQVNSHQVDKSVCGL